MSTEYMFDDPYSIDEDEEMFLEGEDFIEVNRFRSKSFSIKMTKLVDGSSTLALLADGLRDYADFLESMYDEGYQLSSPIVDGIGFAYVLTEEDEG